MVPQEFLRAILHRALPSDHPYRLPDVYRPELDRKVLKGPFVIEILDWVEISKPKAICDGLVDAEIDDEEMEQLPGLRGNQQVPEASNSFGKRMFKFKCSDGGEQDFFGFEYKAFRDFDDKQAQPGCKILVKEVKIMRGLLAFIPEGIQVLGGDFSQEQQKDMGNEDEDPDFLAQIAAVEQEAMMKKTVQEKEKQKGMERRIEKKVIQPIALEKRKESLAGPKKKKKKRFLDDDDDF